jgi:hypothetical protein
MSEDAIREARRWFAEELRFVARVSATEVIEAFASVPRESFVGPGPRRNLLASWRGMARLKRRYVRSSQVWCLISAGPSGAPDRPSSADLAAQTVILHTVSIRMKQYMTLNIRNPKAERLARLLGRAQ